MKNLAVKYQLGHLYRSQNHANLIGRRAATLAAMPILVAVPGLAWLALCWVIYLWAQTIDGNSKRLQDVKAAGLKPEFWLVGHLPFLLGSGLLCARAIGLL